MGRTMRRTIGIVGLLLTASTLIGWNQAPSAPAEVPPAKEPMPALSEPTIQVQSEHKIVYSPAGWNEPIHWIFNPGHDHIRWLPVTR